MKYIGFVMVWIFALVMAVYFYTFFLIYKKYRGFGQTRKQAFLSTWRMYE